MHRERARERKQCTRTRVLYAEIKLGDINKVSIFLILYLVFLIRSAFDSGFYCFGCKKGGDLGNLRDRVWWVFEMRVLG